MIKRALICDLETTGIDPQADAIVEIGLILYGVESHTTLLQFSALLPTEKQNAAEHINRIPQQALTEMMEIECDVDSISTAMLTAADILVCHNGLEFDRLFLGPKWQAKLYVDTKHDFVWTMSRPGASLVDIALAHGIGVSSAHRALTDCQLIAVLFDRQTDLQSMFDIAMRPKFLHRALVDYDEREAAKSAGFQWHPDKKSWLRRMTPADADALPFKTVCIEKGVA